MVLTVRYTEKHERPELGKYWVKIEGIRGAQFYAATKEEAMEKAQISVFGTFALLLEKKVKKPEDFRYIEFREEEV